MTNPVEGKPPPDNGPDGLASSRLPAKRPYPRLKDLAGTNLPSPARLVLAALCDYANPKVEMWPPGAVKSDGFAAWPSVATLMGVTGLGERTVQIGLRTLEEAGAIRCIRRSRGGGSRKAGETTNVGTSCYLLTPHNVRRDAAIFESTPQDLRSEDDFTPHNMHPVDDLTPHAMHRESATTPHPTAEHPAYPAPPPRTICTPHPAPHAPEETIIIIKEEEQGEETNQQNPLRSNPDDDDGTTERRRAPLEDPFEELALRFRERFGSGSEAILRIVLDGISPTRQEAQEFADFDEAHTGAPQDLTNPGGYYRTLVVKFQLAQANKRERQRLERQRQLERQYAAPADPQPVCPLARCNGRGEVYDTGRLVSVCECEAGQRLPTAVRETMALLKRGAA